MLKKRNEVTAVNVANALAGAVLFLSPWLFGFSGTHAAAWSAWILGGLIALVALAAVVQLQEWEEWINLTLGVLVTVSPWALGFAGVIAAMWTHLALGLVVAILAGVGARMIRKSQSVTA